VLPNSVKADLQQQIEYSREHFEADRRDNIAGVELPGALERKYPNAGKEWIWQWVFPSKVLSVDPRSEIIFSLALIQQFHPFKVSPEHPHNISSPDLPLIIQNLTFTHDLPAQILLQSITNSKIIQPVPQTVSL
jgi:hypothetical protein